MLPGSAIGMVYDVALKRYAEIVPRLISLRDQALSAALAASSAHPAAAAHAVPVQPMQHHQSISAMEVHGAIPLTYPSSYPAIPGHPAAVLKPPTASNCFAFNSLGFSRTEIVAVPAALIPPGTQVNPD